MSVCNLMNNIESSRPINNSLTIFFDRLVFVWNSLADFTVKYNDQSNELATSSTSLIPSLSLVTVPFAGLA